MPKFVFLQAELTSIFQMSRAAVCILDYQPPVLLRTLEPSGLVLLIGVNQQQRWLDFPPVTTDGQWALQTHQVVVALPVFLSRV